MTHLRKEDFIVGDIPMQRARQLVRRYHYAKGGSKTGVYYHGLYDRNLRRNVGVAWWLPPATLAAARRVYPSDPSRVLALSRLVIRPGYPTNSASFLLGRSIRLVRDDGRFDCLVTYADTRLGHTGTIYRATNWEYLGLTKKYVVWLDPRTGQEVSKRKGRRTLRKQEMLDLGFVYAGRFAKHRFRMILR
jgi:hypothetical protein